MRSSRRWARRRRLAGGFNEENAGSSSSQRQPLALGVPHCGDTGGRSSTAFHSSLSAFLFSKLRHGRYRRCRRADGHFYNRRCKSSRPGAHTAVARRSLHSGMLRRLRAAALGAKRAACKAYACFDAFRRRFAVLAPVGHMSLWQAASAAGAAVLSWKTLLFQLFNLMLLPSFWLPVVTLCIAARRRKTASPRQ